MPVLCLFPPEYQDLQRAFSKTSATKLPLHRPWDCAIDIQPGAPLPRGHVYPLSYAETEAMGTYIKEALDQGFIRPSTSPAVCSVFSLSRRRTEDSNPALTIGH